jgi:hypothetical protein
MWFILYQSRALFYQCYFRTVLSSLDLRACGWSKHDVVGSYLKASLELKRSRRTYAAACDFVMPPSLHVGFGATHGVCVSLPLGCDVGAMPSCSCALVLLAAKMHLSCWKGAVQPCSKYSPNLTYVVALPPSSLPCLFMTKYSRRTRQLHQRVGWGVLKSSRLHPWHQVHGTPSPSQTERLGAISSPFRSCLLLDQLHLLSLGRQRGWRSSHAWLSIFKDEEGFRPLGAYKLIAKNS